MRFLILAFFVLLTGVAGSARQIMIFNYGDEPIFWVSVGHVQTAQWSEDVLPSNDVIDVGEGKTVSVPVGSDCIYDLRAKYHDGDTVELSGIDLCTATSVRFEH